jgi:NTE family protein
MATFGVKLEDELHEDNPNRKVKKGTLMSFLGQVFSTVRFHYDRDFLKRNSVYEKCIAHVDVENINWLNFGMDRTTQQDLFIRGARAAEIFFCGGTFYNDGKPQAFEGFNWEEFKLNRKKVVEEIESRSK